MASTYSNLKFELIGTGDQPGAWGTTTNTNLGTAIEQAIVGMATISSGFVTNSLTLTLTDTNAAQNARALVLNLTQALSGAGTLNVPAIQKPYMIINATGQTVTVKVTGLTGVAVPNGTRAFLYNNGTDVGEFFNYHSSLTLGTALPVASGGTGSSTACGARTNLGLGTIATQPASNVNITGGSITGITDLAIADGGTGASSAPAARTNLGATTVGSNFFTLTNPSAITFLRINADNTVSTLDAATFRTAIGAGTGGGSVSCVNTSGSVNGLTLTGGPITTTGTVTLGGGVNVSTITTGTLPVARGGTGLCAVGSSGNVLTSNGTAWVSQAAGGGGANVQSFTAGGTYTKPPGAKFVMVEMWGAGGGGGAGYTNFCPPQPGIAGAGGGGGAYVYRVFNAPVVGATETVTIGAGGAAGARSPTGVTATNSGAKGGDTNFGTLLYVFGGFGGGGGAGGQVAGVGGGIAGFCVGYSINCGYQAGLPSSRPINLFGRGGQSPSPGIGTAGLCGVASKFLGVWGGGSGGATAAGQSGFISIFGGGGGGSGTKCCNGGCGGAGRFFGTPPSTQNPISKDPIATNSGGGGKGARLTPTGANATAGNDFNGGGGGASGPRPGPQAPYLNGAAGGIAGGGGGGGSTPLSCAVSPTMVGVGGAGGNGYVIVYSWS